MKHTFLLLIALFLVSCNNNQEKNDFIIARVGNKTLTKKNADSVFSSKGIEIGLAPGLVLEWVDNTVLYREAEKAGFTKDQSLQEKRDAFYRDLVVFSYINNLAERPVRITKNKIKSYYKKNRASFLRRDAEVFAAHYTTKSKTDANQLRKQLLSREGQLSLDSSKFTKEIQNIKKGRLVVSLDKPLFLGKQDIVGPIKNKDLYHVFKVFSRYKKGSQKDLSGCYDEIYQRLYKRAVADRATHVLDSLKQIINIYINPEYQ